ncbi:MAG: MXAN_6577-like cysteine-rich protein [Nannocystaceae bacterium]
MRLRPRLWLLCGLACGDPAGEAASEATSTDTATDTATATATATSLGETTTTTSGPGEPTSASEPTGGCPAPLEPCDGACVDLGHDPGHCGGCGLACDDGLACVEGACDLACGASSTPCGGSCRDLEVDPEHCGACDHACPPGVGCADGVCALECGEGQAACGEACVELGNDEAHCGGCDITCPIGQPCVYGECVAATRHHVLITGQSLSTGAKAAPVSTMQPYANVSFNTGVRAGGVGLTSFIPLVETWNGVEGETIASGLANGVAAAAEARGEAYAMLVSAHGVSGQPYSALKKGTGPYAQGMAQVAAGIELAIQAGEDAAPRAVAVIHGEADQIGGNLAYTAALLSWQSDYEADVAAIVGAARPLPLFLCQMSSFTFFSGATSIIPGQQLAAARARPDRIFLVAPKYFLPYADGVHLTGEGERWLGEYYAKAYRKVLIDGERWAPLWPVAVAREGAVITVDFAVPAPPLVLDEVLVTNPGHFGFEYTDSSGAPPAIASVMLVGEASVQVTLEAPPAAGDRRIRYAFTGVKGQWGGPTTGARGNLRDSDATPSPNGYALYNWAVHFDEPVP